MMLSFFQRLFGRASSVPTSPEPLWMTAAEFAEIPGIDPRSVCRRFGRALRRSNGDRSTYERVIPAPRGGGLGGQMKEYNLAAIARDFPRAISAEELSRARAWSRGVRFPAPLPIVHFDPGDEGEPMTDETKDTAPAAESPKAQIITEILSARAALVAKVHEVLADASVSERRAILKAAIQLLNY